MLGLGLLLTIAACAIAMTAQLGSIVSSTNAAASEPAQITINTGAGGSSMVSDAAAGEYVADDGSQVPDDLPPVGRSGENTCAGAKLKFDNTDCIVNGMTAVGPQAILEKIFMPLSAIYEWKHVAIEDIAEAGDTVYVRGVEEGRYLQTGKSARSNFVHVLTVRNGKLASFEHLYDTQVFRDCES